MADRVSVALIYDSMNIIVSDKLFCLIWILLYVTKLKINISKCKLWLYFLTYLQKLCIKVLLSWFWTQRWTVTAVSRWHNWNTTLHTVIDFSTSYDKDISSALNELAYLVHFKSREIIFGARSPLGLKARGISCRDLCGWAPKVQRAYDRLYKCSPLITYLQSFSGGMFPQLFV